MADIFTREKRSEVMSKIRSKDTKPELLVRKFLFANGFRYRLHYKKLPGHPDIVLPKYRVVIFINGCFWHDHINCKYAKTPKTNVVFWAGKIGKNKIRDKLNHSLIKRLGWKVYLIWECQLMPSKREKTLNDLFKKLIK